MTGEEDGTPDGPIHSKSSLSGTSGAEVAGAGFLFGATVVAFAFAGIWLDKQLGTTPWMVIVMVFAGAALGFYSLYRKLMKQQRLGDRRKSHDRRERP